MDFITLVLIIFSIIPGIYLAWKKYLLVILNKKLNIFPIRLMFTIPAGFAFTFLVSLIPVVVLGAIFKNIISFDYIFAGILILSSLFVTLIFQKYYVRADCPPEYDLDFMNYELYIYMPVQTISRKKYNHFYFPPKVQWDKELLTGTQKENLKLNFKSLDGKDFVFTDYGEIVVNEKILAIFSKNKFNDLYETKPIETVKGLQQKPHDLKKPYFQLVPNHKMPPLDPKTNIQKKCAGFSLRHYATDDKFYYNQKVMEKISAFNITDEVLGAYDGSPYYPQHLWIVTNEAMSFLINELNQNRRDFIPVHLVDDSMN